MLKNKPEEMEVDIRDEISEGASSLESEELNQIRSYVISKVEEYFKELDLNLARIVEKDPNEEFYQLAQKDIDRVLRINVAFIAFKMWGKA